jgi:hypothetical protein
LVVPSDATRFEEVSRERQVGRVRGDSVQAQDGEFELGMARVAV